MNRLQSNPWGKGAAAVLLLVCAALSGLFGAFVLRGLLYQGVDSWQDTGRFTTLLQERQASVAALVADSLAVGRLPLGGYTNEEQWAMGVETWESAGGTYLIWPEEELGYVEIRRYEQDIETHAALLDPEKGLLASDRGTLDVSYQQTDGEIRGYFAPEEPEPTPEPTPEPEAGEGEGEGEEEPSAPQE